MREAHWPDIAGRQEGAVHRLGIRVYYEDTDFSGAVYHASYLKFCERGRSDMLRLAGVHHAELARDGLAFAVRRMDCEFLKPARIDDLIEVESRVSSAAGARIVINQRVLRQGAVLFSAEVTVALIDSAGRPRRLPPGMAAALDFAASASTDH